MLSILRLLDTAQVDYVLVGGLAVTLHGYQRVTMDVDVVLAMTGGNLGKFTDAAKQAGLEPVIPVAIDDLPGQVDIEELRRIQSRDAPS